MLEFGMGGGQMWRWKVSKWVNLVWLEEGTGEQGL